MPDVGVQVPPEPGRLVAGAGRGGRHRPGRPLQQRRSHHPRGAVPEPAPGAQGARAARLRADRAPLRLPAVPRSRVDGAGRARRGEAQVLELHPAPRLGPPPGEARPPRRWRRARSRRAARGEELSEEELTALFSETRPEVIEEMRVAADELRAELAGETATFVVNRNINFTNVCVVGCAFCGFGQGKRSPDAYHVAEEDFAARVQEAIDFGATEICMQGGIHPDYTLEDYGRWLSFAKECAPEHPPARLLADGDPLHVRALRPLAGLGLRVPDRVRARLDARGRPPRCSTTASASGSRRTSCRSRAGSRSSRPRTAPACARPRR